MKITCLRETLNKGLAAVGRAVASQSSLPALTHVLLSTDGGRLQLSATNLQIGITCWLGAKVDEDGAISVPARTLPIWSKCSRRGWWICKRTAVSS